ncbi:hypothetical protein, partial [Natrinema sp. JCM 9743]
NVYAAHMSLIQYWNSSLIMRYDGTDACSSASLDIKTRSTHRSTLAQQDQRITLTQRPDSTGHTVGLYERR